MLRDLMDDIMKIEMDSEDGELNYTALEGKLWQLHELLYPEENAYLVNDDVLQKIASFIEPPGPDPPAAKCHVVSVSLRILWRLCELKETAWKVLTFHLHGSFDPEKKSILERTQRVLRSLGDRAFATMELYELQFCCVGVLCSLMTIASTTPARQKLLPEMIFKDLGIDLMVVMSREPGPPEEDYDFQASDESTVFAAAAETLYDFLAKGRPHAREILSENGNDRRFVAMANSTRVEMVRLSLLGLSLLCLDAKASKHLNSEFTSTAFNACIEVGLWNAESFEDVAEEGSSSKVQRTSCEYNQGETEPLLLHSTALVMWALAALMRNQSGAGDAKLQSGWATTLYKVCSVEDSNIHPMVGEAACKCISVLCSDEGNVSEPQLVMSLIQLLSPTMTSEVRCSACLSLAHVAKFNIDAEQLTSRNSNWQAFCNLMFSSNGAAILYSCAEPPRTSGGYQDMDSVYLRENATCVLMLMSFAVTDSFTRHKITFPVTLLACKISRQIVLFATVMIWAFGRQSDQRRTLGEVGAVTRLLSIVEETEDKQTQAWATAALWMLCIEEDNASRLAQSTHGINLICRLVSRIYTTIGFDPMEEAIGYACVSLLRESLSRIP